MFNMYDIVNTSNTRKHAIEMPKALDLRQLSVEDIDAGIHCMSDEERYGQLDPFVLFAVRENMRYTDTHNISLSERNSQPSGCFFLSAVHAFDHTPN